MKKKRGAAVGNLLLVFILLLAGALSGGCSGAGTGGGQPASGTEVSAAVPEAEAETEKAGESASEEAGKVTAEPAALPDGTYTAEFDTDSSMFRVNEAYDGKGTLTVENGEMTIHISLVSKNIVSLYPGLAEDAQKEGAQLLSPTTDTVAYSDGWTEEVYGFDIPVPALEEEFDLALLGAKGKWYDHKVSVSEPEPLEEGMTQMPGAAELEEETEQTPGAAESEEEAGQTPGGMELADGVYTMEVTLEGGSGRAEVLSPAEISVSEGKATALIQWNSPNYDYMIAGGETYLPVNTEGNSAFEIPVSVFDEPMDVIGDTVAMSTPHEIEYTLTFHSGTVKPAD